MISEYLMQVPLKQRIYLGHALLVVLFALATGLAIFGFFQTYRRMALIEQISHQRLLQQEISEGVIAVATEAQRFTAEGKSSSVQRVRLLNERLSRQIEEMHGTPSSPEMKGIFLKMEQHLAVFNRTFQTVIGERTLRAKLLEADLPAAAAVINETLIALEGDPTLAIGPAETRAWQIQLLGAQKDLSLYLDVLDFSYVQAAGRQLDKLRIQLGAGRGNPSVMSALVRAREATDAYQHAMVRAVQATQGYLYLTDVVMAGELAEFLFMSERLGSLSADDARRGYGNIKASMTRTMIALAVAFLFVFLFAPFFAFHLSTGIVEEITARRRAEAELRESETELRVMAESMPQMVWKCRPDGWNVYFNQRWVDYTGLTQEESRGHGWLKPFHPEDQQRVADAWQNALEDGAVEDPECRLRDRHGAYRWFLIRGVPHRNETGAVLWWFGTCTDIDEIKQAEESLRLLNSAVEQSKESIVITDAQLDLPGPRILFVNPAFTEATGYTAGEVLGKTPRILQGPRSDRAALRRLRESLSRGEVFAGETINYRKDGTEYTQEWQVAPIRNVSGAITHFVAIARDITERKRADEKLHRAYAEFRSSQSLLVQAEKMASLGRMTAGVAHEINNPMSFVTTNLVNLRRDFQDFLEFNATVKTLLPELAVAAPAIHEQLAGRFAELELDYLAASVPKTLADNLEGLERVKRIVLDLRRFSRLDEDEFKPCDLAADITATLRFLSPLLAEHDVRLETHFAALPPLVCSAGHLNQAVSNIVGNAIQASRPGQTVKVSTFAWNDRCLIQVTDAGEGIAPENLARVFDPFFTTKAVGSGTGLGLHIVHQIVTAHHGEIRIKSERGQGTTVTMEVPFKPPANGPPTAK